MADKRTRDLIDRLDEAIRVIGSLRPKNPADVTAIFHNNRIAVAAAKELTAAIGYFRMGHHDTYMKEHLDAADAILSDEGRSDG